MKSFLFHCLQAVLKEKYYIHTRSEQIKLEVYQDEYIYVVTLNMCTEQVQVINLYLWYR